MPVTNPSVVLIAGLLQVSLFSSPLPYRPRRERKKGAVLGPLRHAVPKNGPGTFFFLLTLGKLH